MRFEQQLKQFCKEKDFSRRLEFYKAIDKNECLSFPHNGQLSDVVSKRLSCLLNYLLADFMNSDDETINVYLNVVNRLHSDVDTQLSVDEEVAIEFLKKLLLILRSSKSNSTIQKVINLLGLQRFPENVLAEVVELFLKGVPVTNSAADGSIITVFNRFIKQCPEAMMINIELWLKLLLRLTCHSDVYVREQSVSALKENLAIILSNKKKILAVCGGFLKEDVLPNLNTLCAKEDILFEILSVQLPVYMAIIGEDYRRSSRLSNSILKFVEKGFCHGEEKIKMSAFSAWDCLIDCFAGSKDLLASTKYFRLFTQPLKLKLKTEALTKALIQTMWKLAVHLDDSFIDLFEMLCIPLFGICFRGSARAISQRRSGGRLSFSNCLIPCENVQVLGAEILSHLLVSPSSQPHDFCLGPLHIPYFANPAVFARFHETLISTVCDTLCQLHVLFSSEFLLNIWNVTLSCVKTCLAKRRDGIEMFKNLYQSSFRIIEAGLEPDLLLLIVSSLTSFPNKILNSSLHHQSDSVAGSMHGTPIVSVLRLLFSDNVSCNNLKNPKFEQCAKTVIACGMERRIGNLEFIQSVVSRLDDSNKVFLNIWTYLCQQIVVYLDESGNVNDGDSFEHDFSSIYDTLLYPFSFIFNTDADLCDQSSEIARNSWSELFKRFAPLTSAIPSTEKNEARLYFASRILDKLSATNITKLMKCQLSFFEVVLFEILNGADFSTDQAKNQRRRTKSKKKAPQDGAIEQTVYGFNSVVMELLTHLEAVFVTSHTSFPLFNILSSVDVIISSVSSSLVAPFFTKCSSFLFHYVDNLRDLPDSLASSLEQTWSQTLLRLPFSQLLLESESTAELFSLVLSNFNSPLYKDTVDFWEMKVLDVFDPDRISDDFLDVITEMYKKEGFIISWKQQNTTLNLNDSTVSDRSIEETDLSGSVVSESDVSGRDDVSSDVIIEVNDFESKVKKSTDDNDDDLTQLENLTEDSDDSPRNRSLNLRSLANRAVGDTSKSSFISMKNSSLLSGDDQSIDPTSNYGSSFEAPSSSCIVVSDSEDEDPKKSGETDSCILPDTVINTTSDSFPSAPVILSSENESDSSKEFIEMTHVSVNVDLDDVTIESSQDEVQRSSRPKQRVFSNVGRDRSRVEGVLNETNLADDFSDDTSTETVEMVEMSVLNNSRVNTAPDNDCTKQLDEESIYEYVEMAEVSVHPSNSSRIQSQTDFATETSDQISEKNTDNRFNSSVDINVLSDCDNSVYETVEMKEISINPQSEPNNTVSISNDDINISSNIDHINKQVQSPQPDDISSPQPTTPESNHKILMSKRNCKIMLAKISQQPSSPNDKSRDFDSLSAAPNEICSSGPFQNSFNEASVHDLGVKPLDSSFEGCESFENSPSKADPPKTIYDDVENTVIKDSLPLDETIRSPTEKKKRKMLKTTKQDSSNKKMSKKKKLKNKKDPPSSADSPSRTSQIGNDDVNTLSDVTSEQTKNCLTDCNSIDPPMTSVISPQKSDETKIVTDSDDKKDPDINNDEQVPSNPIIKMTSPQPSVIEEADTPRSCLGKRTSMLQEDCDTISLSESPCGILKKRISDYPSPATKARRVSFAEPISVSSDSPTHPVFHSPYSSPRHVKRQHLPSRLVSRRLSLPVNHRSYESASPVSVRSASIAAAIADIKAKNNGDAPASTPSKILSCDVNTMSAAQLKDFSFLKSLSVPQLERVVDIIHQAAPMVHSILLNKLKNQNR